MIITPQEMGCLNLGGMTVGMTSGCYDLLHFYHLHYLERCRAECDFLVVGTDADSLVLKNKQKTPVWPEFQRVAMLSSMRCVDAAFIMRTQREHDAVLEILTALHTSAVKLFKNEPAIYGRPVTVPDGVDLVILPDVAEATSTSAMIQKIITKQPTPQP